MRARALPAARKALRVITRPVRRAQGRGGLVVEPYRGYGSAEEIFLIGRVFRQSPGRAGEDPESWRAQWRDVRRRIARRSVAGVPITARFRGAETRVVTDADGYFRIHLRPLTRPEGDGPWHAVDLTLDADPVIPAKGAVYIPPAGCSFVVVSDIDDTVMRTGVANKLTMLWRLFVEDADSRVAFPGVSALYRALHGGADGKEGNPMLYVSRAPWGLYEMLTEFFQRHDIPAGPVLFLREWGLSWTHPLPRRAEDHKQALIRHMLTLYPTKPFVLIGDSGQHDPEVYAQIVTDHPGRVKAVYIRNVSRNAVRAEEVVKLAGAVTASGSSLVLAADSVAIARHAAGLGLIKPDAITAVADEHAGSDAPPPQSVTIHIQPPPPSPGEPPEAVLAPDVIAAISPEGEVPATVVVAASNTPGLSPLTRV